MSTLESENVAPRGLPMNDRLLLGLDAFVLALFGAALLVAPGPTLSLAGGTLGMDGRILAELLGGFMLAMAAHNWMARGTHSYRMAVTAIVTNLIKSSIGAFALFDYAIHHPVSTVAWLVAGLFLVFTGCYAALFARRRRMVGARSVGTVTHDEWF